MKTKMKHALAVLLALCMVLTALSTAVLAASDSRKVQKPNEDVSKIFKDIGFWCTVKHKYIEYGKNAPDDIVYEMSIWDLKRNGDKYYVVENETENEWGTFQYGYWTMSHAEYMKLLDGMFAKHSDMKDYLSKQVFYTYAGEEPTAKPTDKFQYDAATDTVTINELVGGFGDIWDWEPLTMFVSGNDYFVEGLYLRDILLTDEELAGLVENVDYYTLRDEGENGEIIETKMPIKERVELHLIKTATGYQIASYERIPYHMTVDAAGNQKIWTEDGNTYSPFTVTYYVNGKEVCKASNLEDIAENAGAFVTFTNRDGNDVPSIYPVKWFTPEELQCMQFDSVIDFIVAVNDGYKLDKVTGSYYIGDYFVKDQKPEKDFGNGFYSMYGCENLDIQVYLTKAEELDPAPDVKPEEPDKPATPDEPSKPAADDKSKVEISVGLTEVPAGLKDTEYNTVEKIEQKLAETLKAKENKAETVLYEVELKTSADGGKTWETATAENFPKEGLTVTLPYPEGTNAKDFDFSAAHIFAENCNGFKAGDVETPEVTKTADGISFKVMGLSPIMISYTHHTENNGEQIASPDTDNNTYLPLLAAFAAAAAACAAVTVVYTKRRKLIK